jgi:hypothetical protein
MGTALSAVLWCAACGSSEEAAAANGTESGASQTAQPSTAGQASAPTAAAAGGKATAPTASGAAGSAAKPTSTTPASSPSGNAGAAGAPASSGASPAAGSGGSPSGAPAAGGAAGDGAAGGAGTPAAMTDECDRQCLLDIMQQYLDALIAHDPAMVKTAASVKVTDNGVDAKLGDGLFKSGTMILDDHRLDFADPTSGNVTTHVVINEGSMGVIYQARLKVEKREITEIETMTVYRQGAANGFFNIENMKPEAVFLQEVPAEKRMSRDELNAITELYLDYLEGKKRGPDVPFDEGCKRYENGAVTANGLSSFNAQSWSFMLTRRTLVIDEEAQITWGMYPFFQSDNTLVVGEAFKIIEGKIMMIQAVMAYQPSKIWD